MSKFDEDFDEPMYFSHGAYVVTGKISREDAAQRISEHIEEEVTPESIVLDRVRFGFPPDCADCEPGVGVWCTGAGKGKGTQPVWVLE